MKKLYHGGQYQRGGPYNNGCTKNGTPLVLPRLKDRETAIEKLSPSMLKYLRAVIDYPMTKHPHDNFRDVYIAQLARYGEVGATGYLFNHWDYAWSANMRRNIAKRLTKEELLEVCDIIVKEAA